MPLAETSRPCACFCLRTLPSQVLLAQVAGPGTLFPTSIWTAGKHGLGGECDSPVSRRQFRYGQRPGGIGRLLPPSHPSPSTGTFPDVPSQMSKGLSVLSSLRVGWLSCTSSRPIYSPLRHVSLNLGRVGGSEEASHNRTGQRRPCPLAGRSSQCPV